MMKGDEVGKCAAGVPTSAPEPHQVAICETVKKNGPCCHGRVIEVKDQGKATRKDWKKGE